MKSIICHSACSRKRVMYVEGYSRKMIIVGGLWREPMIDVEPSEGACASNGV